MRCRRRSSCQQNYIEITPLRRLHLISQLSLTASPPRGSLLVGCDFQYAQSAAFSPHPLLFAQHLLPFGRRLFSRAVARRRKYIAASAHCTKGFSLGRSSAAGGDEGACWRKCKQHYYFRCVPPSSVSLFARHLLLREKAFIVMRFHHAWLISSTIAVSHACFPRPTMPAGQRTAQLDARAGEARPKGKYSRGRMALAPIRARRIFPATGAHSPALPSNSNPTFFHVTHRFFVTFLTQERNVTPPFPRPPVL